MIDRLLFRFWDWLRARELRWQEDDNAPFIVHHLGCGDPPLPRLMDLFPVFRAERGGIRYPRPT